jgi:hypothetical protein
MQRWFEIWGRPQQIQFDHGSPWYSTQGQMPTLIALWLAGLDIEVVWSRPGKPQDNGIVERAHRTMQSWTASPDCRNLQQLQQRLDHNSLIQRQDYPDRDGQTRLQRYPQLAENQRPYQAQQESQQWSLTLAQRPLHGQQWQRKVTTHGYISLYNRNYLVGRAYAHQSLWVGFDPETAEWVCRNDAAQEVKRLPSHEINATVIRQLLVHRPRALRNNQPPKTESGQLSVVPTL